MKTNFSSTVLLFIFLNVLFSLNAQENNPKKWTPEDVVNIEDMKSVSFSPSNNMVLWTKEKADKENDKFVSDIYLTRLDILEKGLYKTIQLTNMNENDTNPIFSKDGEYVYFLSSREKGKNLWKMSLYGGEPEEIYEFKNGISNIKWQNSNTLLFVSNEGETLYEKELKEKKDDVEVVEDSIHWKPNRVYAFDLKEKTIKRITNNKKPLDIYVVSENGEWLIYSMLRSTSYDVDAQKDPFYYLQNLNTGETIQIIEALEFPSFSFQFSQDNKGFYFLTTFASDPKWNGSGIFELYYYTIATKSYTKVDLQCDLGVGNGYKVVGNNALVSLANKATHTLAYYTKNGTNWSKSLVNLAGKEGYVTVLKVANSSSKIIYNYSRASTLPEFYVADFQKNKFTNEKELVKLNTNLKEKPLTKSEVFIWKGYKDEEVTGILYYPENYEKGKRYPLILSIHGGPMFANFDTFEEDWSTYPNILAQRGAFVLKPNYHGSSNHGLSFIETIKGNYYEPEVEDIIKAINILDAKEMIDMNMLGTMGWSNGAIISTMLTLKYPDLFKVSAPGAGDVNWTSDYGTCSFGVSFDQSYFGGAPWDDTNGKFYNETYIIKSPIFEVEKIKTPTIIFHGSDDRAVPRDQGWEYYRGLQQVGITPVRFLWFPGQPHSLQKISYQLRKMNEELEWIDTYLFKKPSTKNEAFKKESPLANLLKLDKAARSSNGNYGVLVNGKLIPETVSLKKDSIEIGLFEVTNAQFKVYMNDFSYTEGLDNYPAVVSKNQAESYAKWLSLETGKIYRLPNSEEAKSLHKSAYKAAANENTLNYWAGYEITLDEVDAFKNKLNETKSMLYKKVGQFNSYKIGDAEIYDLGGNVAEYFENGIYGYSAYDFYDTANPAMILSEHVGIRVVKE